MSLVNDFVFAGVPSVYLLIGLVIYRYKPTQRLSIGLTLVIVGVLYLFLYTTMLNLLPNPESSILVFAPLLVIVVLANHCWSNFPRSWANQIKVNLS